MDTYWTYDTQGDPLTAVRRLVGAVWQEAGLEAMLVPHIRLGDPEVHPHWIENPAGLENINPFHPSMSVNAARLIPDLLRERPNARLGALLRPCEVRSLHSMSKRAALSIHNLVTISVDCLATFPAEDLDWRTSRKGTTNEMYTESLRFARQGGVSAYRYRPACQVCSSQAAGQADFNIGVLGVPVRQHLLLQAPAEPRFPFPYERFASHAASNLLAQRERILERQNERHERTQARLLEGLAALLPHSLEQLADLLERCGLCQTCMENCPICSVAPPGRQPSGRYNLEDLACWIQSCSGCGMCEQSCPSHLPLGTIFTHLRSQIVM
jgi:formate dehydrogenase (coenzyme F420) beta subunit